MKLKGQATEADIKKWKTEYPQGIYAVEVGGHAGYFMNPTRAHVNRALSAAAEEKAQPLAAIEKFVEITWIGGSDEILKTDGLYLGVCSVLQSKMNGVHAKLVNI